VTDFALCRTCPEVTTGRQDSSKGWLLDASSNHHHCEVVTFGNLADLPMPIRNVVMRLGAGVPVRDIDISMFKLGLDMEDQWTPFQSTAPVADSTSPTSAAPVLASAASTKSPLALTPTSSTGAQRDEQLDLFGGAA
jgi:hypothetical protein